MFNGGYGSVESARQFMHTKHSLNIAIFKVYGKTVYLNFKTQLLFGGTKAADMYTWLDSSSPLFGLRLLFLMV